MQAEVIEGKGHVMQSTTTKRRVVKRRWGKKDPRIGRRILKARTAKGISQRALSQQTPYTAAYLSRIENGERTPSVAYMRAVAPMLGVAVAWLETGRDDVEVVLPRRFAEQLAAEADQPELVAALTRALHRDPALT